MAGTRQPPWRVVKRHICSLFWILGGKLLSQLFKHSTAQHKTHSVRSLIIVLTIMANLRSDTIELMADRGIPVAQLSIISLAKIHAKDPAELGILEKAASNTGFFYLDLRGDTKGEHVLAHLPLVYGVTEKYFAQPEEVKAKNIRLDIKASQDLGWKKGHGGESFEVGTPN